MKKKSTATIIAYGTSCIFGLVSFCFAEYTKNDDSAIIRGMGQFCRLIGILNIVDVFLTLGKELEKK